MLAGLVAALAGGCSPTPVETAQPRQGRAGLQLTGTVANRQLAVSDGGAELVTGDCDPSASADTDVCVIADDIDGQLVVLVFENPDVLRAPATLTVTDPGCGQDCDDVADGVVVDLQLGTGERRRAHGGSVELETVIPFSRYVGELRLELPSGMVSGSFDVVPRRD